MGAPLLRRWGHGGRTQLRLWGGAHLILPLQEVTLHIHPPALHAQTEAPEGTLEQGRWGWPALSASRPWVPASPSALDCGRLPVCHDRGGGTLGRQREERGVAPCHPGLKAEPSVPVGRGAVTGIGGQSHGAGVRRASSPSWWEGRYSQEPQRYRNVLFSLKPEPPKTRRYTGECLRWRPSRPAQLVADSRHDRAPDAALSF